MDLNLIKEFHKERRTKKIDFKELTIQYLKKSCIGIDEMTGGGAKPNKFTNNPEDIALYHVNEAIKFLSGISSIETHSSDPMIDKMTIREKLFSFMDDLKETIDLLKKDINKNPENFDEDFDLYSDFDVYSLANHTLNWPEIKDEDGDTDSLDLENFEITEIDDEHILMACGGDWQNPHWVDIRINDNNGLYVSKFYLCENYPDYSINVLEYLLGN